MTKAGHRRRGLTVEPKSIRLGVFSLAPAARTLHCRFPEIVAGLLNTLQGRIISAQNNRGRNAMIALSRRNVLAFAGGITAAALAQRADAAIGPNDKFDLVIKGGDVLDPSQSLRGKRDVGIRWGVVEAVEEAIPAERATKTIDASGKFVTPGLVDLHCHVYPYGSAIGIPADELVQFQGTTTVVSAGDAGVNNLAALRRYIVAQSRARMYAF